MNSAEKAKSLAIVAQMYRFSYPPEILGWQLRALQGRFNGLMVKNGISGREQRLRLVAACVGRPVDSFTDLKSGEIKAILEEQDLEEILIYLHGVNHAIR